MAIDRETVVRTALTLLNEVGLDRLTLRGIAAALQVQAPALYWHFRNKQDLLDAMATTVLMDAVGPADWPDTEWRSFLHAYGEGLRAALLRYRDGAKMVPGTYLTDPGMYLAQERALRVLVDGGFEPEAAQSALTTVYSYTVGFAIEEQAMFPWDDEPDDLYSPHRRLHRIDAAATPLVARLAATDSMRDSDANFAAGLRIIVAGLAARRSSNA